MTNPSQTIIKQELISSFENFELCTESKSKNILEKRNIQDVMDVEVLVFKKPKTEPKKATPPSLKNIPEWDRTREIRNISTTLDILFTSKKLLALKITEENKKITVPCQWYGDVMKSLEPYLLKSVKTVIDSPMPYNKDLWNPKMLPKVNRPYFDDYDDVLELNYSTFCEINDQLVQHFLKTLECNQLSSIKCTYETFSELKNDLTNNYEIIDQQSNKLPFVSHLKDAYKTYVGKTLFDTLAMEKRQLEKLSTHFQNVDETDAKIARMTKVIKDEHCNHHLVLETLKEAVETLSAIRNDFVDQWNLFTLTRFNTLCKFFPDVHQFSKKLISDCWTEHKMYNGKSSLDWLKQKRKKNYLVQHNQQLPLVSNLTPSTSPRSTPENNDIKEKSQADSFFYSNSFSNTPNTPNTSNTTETSSCTSFSFSPCSRNVTIPRRYDSIYSSNSRKSSIAQNEDSIYYCGTCCCRHFVGGHLFVVNKFNKTALAVHSSYLKSSTIFRYAQEFVIEANEKNQLRLDNPYVIKPLFDSFNYYYKEATWIKVPTDSIAFKILWQKNYNGKVAYDRNDTHQVHQVTKDPRITHNNAVVPKDPRITHNNAVIPKGPCSKSKFNNIIK